MSRTFIRQDIQIRPSVTYTDSTAPSEAAFETNPAHIEDDLNNLRSQVHNLLKNQAGNWWDDLNIPSALDTGAQRGVNDLNTDLHALERKRVLVQSCTLADVSVASAVAATGTLTLTGNALDTETVVTGTKTYTFQTVLTNVDGNVLIGATASDSLDNLIAAITLGAGSGTLYAAATTANTFVTAAAGAGDTMDVTALKAGTFGNTIASTETLTNGAWGAATLTGGTGGDVVILGAGELPNNTTAAVGAVTTAGTVVQTHSGTFGTASLDEVSGASAISPKNMVYVVNGATRDPILSDSRKIYGLLQGESGLTDGTTITDTTTTRVQVTFVRINAAGDDLETIDGSDLGGTDVNLCFVERKALEDFTEQDFLSGAIVDVPAATTATRQAGYDNQGTTPVDLTTNATLDLEGAGLVWAIRDDLEAVLFSITEGSAGGTSTLLVGGDVDTFDVNAVTNDFLNGASFDTGAAGTTINVGTTPNQIDSGGALTVASGGAGDLKLQSATADLRFTDSNEPAGWSLDGISLSTDATTWSTFETLFGETSLMDAIIQSAKKENRTKGTAVVSVASIAADTNVTNPTNIDAALPAFDHVSSFQDDCDVFVNGVLMRGDNSTTGANNHDVYPGDTPANGDLKFEFTLRGTGANADVITMIVYGEA